MKRRRTTEQHISHDRWLVSYADFITLLFAFFVVLYASAEMDKRKVVQLSSAIEGAFQQMGAFSTTQAGTSRDGKEMRQAALLTDPKTNLPPTSLTSSGGSVDAYALQLELEKVLADELKQRDIEMRVTPDGLILSLREVGFFASGQAELLPTALPKLARIAQILSTHGFDIRVEGHTDSIPIHTNAFQSNWELSTSRATAVVKLLVESDHLDPLKIAAAGYGPYRPVASNETAQGRQMNRRVDLVITSREVSTTPFTNSGTTAPVGATASDVTKTASQGPPSG
jgi:chemotaxis protein MotB